MIWIKYKSEIMSRLDDYNKKTQLSFEYYLKIYDRRPLFISIYDSTTQKRKLVTAAEFQKKQLTEFNEIEGYFLSDECNWTDMPTPHTDIKFVNHLRKYCEILKNINIASDDRTALELIAENRVALNWETVSEIRRLIHTSWTEADLSYEQAGKVFRVMAKRLLQDVFLNSNLIINAVNFSELEHTDSPTNRSYRPWAGSSNTSISSVGKRKCHLCGKPAIFDTNVCKECNPK